MATEYLETEIHASGTITGGIEYKPKNILASIKYKLIVFLHGIGERGDGSDFGLYRLRVNGSVAGIEAAVRNAGNVIMMEPQTAGNWNAGEVDEIFDIAYSRYGQILDRDCAYLTGLSLGGGGTQRYIAYNPDQKKFAAFAPMCPGGNRYFITNGDAGYQNIAHSKRPGWYFHCADDGIADPDESTNLTFDKCDIINPNHLHTKTIWKSGDHNGGWKTYNRYGTGVPACSPAEALEFNNPACNLLQWFEMNSLARPAVKPPAIGSIPPVVIPDLPTDLAVHGFNFFGENVRIQKVYKAKPAVNITPAAGDEGVNIWIPNILPRRATIDYRAAPHYYVAPELDLIGYNVYGRNVKVQILYTNTDKLIEEAPAGLRCFNVWVPAISPIRGTMSFKKAEDGSAAGFRVIGKV
jgi:hypothetical protein